MTELEKLNFLQTAILAIFQREITLGMDDRLKDIGLDSLDVIELQLYYEEHFDVTLPDTAVFNTVGDLIRLM